MSIDKIRRKERRKSRVRFKLKTINLLNNVRSNKLPKARLSIFRSNNHIYAQIIDDSKGITLVSASTLERDFDRDSKRKMSEKAIEVGQNIGKRAIDKGIKEIIFDRGPYKFHGVVAKLMEAARQKIVNV